jgi:hypothetical protein
MIKANQHAQKELAPLHRSFKTAVILRRFKSVLAWCRGAKVTCCDFPKSMIS